ncbi:cytochrome c [Balneolaceae bacterium YR4-1]|uniref:Cytochrome c n=2 Tax=Halalkalibaculum roseum TaxID=2709311 RepID=A0A6M1TC47_9BACT|nr:cytochrome c [Halalkalibaculum roseum]
MGMVLLLATGCEKKKGENQPENSVITAADRVEKGRYLIMTSGCNDCHTDGFMQDSGKPESNWLTGSALGWQGPWGTTYPPNLRLTVQTLSEQQWLDMLKTRKGMPPMPWPSVNAFNEEDARALYAYIRSLGPKGEHSPLALAPGVEPQTPYLSMMPQNLPLAVSAQ